MLDTHAFLWWASEDDRLSAMARKRIARSKEIGVCAISLWEVAMLVKKGRLALTLDVGTWLAEALALPGVRLLPLLPEVAVASANLPGEFHGDPADRTIVATARELGATLITKDGRIREWGQVRVVW